MKRAVLSLSAAAAALAVAGTVVAAPASKTPPKTPPANSAAKRAAPRISKFRQRQLDQLKTSAPGDEYFGRLKLSYLGINNTFRDDAVRAGAYTTDSRLISATNFADDALHDWSKRYPNDAQLPRSWFLAMKMYRKIYTIDGQQKAFAYMNEIVQRWPTSYFGKLEKADLAKGFTEHYFALPVPCPTPEPTLPPGVKAKPTPSPTPSPMPTFSPTPTPGPNAPLIDIIPVPCVVPTPTPSPTPLPTIAPVPSPSPSRSGSPAPLPSLSPAPLPSVSPAPLPSGSPVPLPTGSLSPKPLPTPLPTRSPRPAHHY